MNLPPATGLYRPLLLASLFFGCSIYGEKPLAGIVVDDSQAIYTGTWTESTRQAALVGKGYHHDDNKGKGEKTARFTATIPETGEYEVRVLYSATANRASNVPVTLEVPGESLVAKLNEREPALVNGVPQAVGTVRYEAGTQAVVIVSNAGTDGFVVVDAVQWLPVALARMEREGRSVPQPSAVSQPPLADTTRAAAVALSPLAAKAVKYASPLKADDEPVCLAKDSPASEVNGKHYDLVVVGGTGSGVLCAVRAAREGCSVLLVQHNRHIGGMMANGLMQWDALYGGPRAPLFTELLDNIEKHYIGTFGRDSKDHQIIRYTHEHYPMSWAEPHVAEREFHRLVAGEKNITLLLSHYVAAVDREGALIKGVTLREYGTPHDLQVTGTTFADATYEGDLFALARVPYRVGREARDEYHEPHAGKVFTNIEAGSPQSVAAEHLNIAGYKSRQGSIDPTSPFTADNEVQAYNYRFCVSLDPANRLLPDKPMNYNREEFANFGRKSIATNPGPNSKSHVNSPILPGENQAYPEASWPEREKIIQRHLDFALGLMWFLQNDESVPVSKRDEFRKWGLAKDEFTDHGHIPYEMYVREARRIVGRHVLTEQDNMPAPGYARTPIQADSIAFTDWYMDSHSCTNDSRPDFHYDGKLILTEETRPGQIPYRSLLPQGVDNLLVPVCLGATHVAWGSVRLEPVWMQTGEAAGFAVALAKKRGIPPAALNPDTLVRCLVDHRQMVSFFNDIKVTGPESWIPAVEYLGTRGFFPSYDARANELLDIETAKLWVAATAKQKNGRQLAASLTKVQSQEPVTAEAFAKLLGLNEKTANDLLAAMNVAPEKSISRGNACLLIYRLMAET
ncbi:MAG: protein-xanthan lyase [Verrucomicrobiaceae bacterium]|nr:protein-xanthan lyase [Verrucomicrobiaceae bacterium]